MSEEQPRPAKVPFRRADLFGGQGEVRIWDLLAGAQAPPFSTALWCELDPNGSVGAHVQQRDPEIIVGISGTGRAHVNDAPHALGVGDLVYLPHGSTLRLENLGDAPLRYLIIKAQV